MERITSFTIDHMTLEKGLYVSRVDKLGCEYYTTFDLRFTRPNFEPVMDTAICHTIEHLAATYFRNTLNNTMYFGPMGCRTGFYLILGGKLEVKDVIADVKKCLNFIIDFTGKIPGASKEECGNYLDMNLDMAKYYAKSYLRALGE